MYLRVFEVEDGGLRFLALTTNPNFLKNIPPAGPWECDPVGPPHPNWKVFSVESSLTGKSVASNVWVVLVFVSYYWCI